MKKYHLLFLLTALICTCAFLGAQADNGPYNLTPEQDRLIAQEKMDLQQEAEARVIEEKDQSIIENELTDEERAELKERKFLAENPGYQEKLDDPPTILITGDDCTDPFIIPESFPYSDAGNTCTFTNLCDITGTDNSDVFYQLDITTSVELVVSLCNSSYDTKLAIFQTECCTGTEWAYNDDNYSACGAGNASQITAFFTPATYFIVVDGYSDNCGDYVLDIFTTPVGQCCYGYPTQCVDGISESECTSTYAGEWTEGLDCNTDCNVGRCCYDNPVQCVDQILESECVDTYAGNWTAGLDCTTPCPEPIDCENPIIVTLPAGLPYSDLDQGNCGRLDSYNETCLGSYDGGEDIMYELNITADIYVDVFFDPKGSTSTGFTIATECPPANCVYTSTAYSGSPRTEPALLLEAASSPYYLMIDTYPTPDCIPDYDLIISASVPGRCCDVTDPYVPVCTDGVYETACVGDNEIWSAGLDCTNDPCPLPPANDLCENAQILSVPSSIQADNIWATDDAMDFCGTGDGNQSVWYVVVGTGNTMTATTCNPYTDFDTKLRVFCNTCTDPYCIGGNDDTPGDLPECDLNGLNRKSTVEWCSEVGTEYLIEVMGFFENAGNFQLDILDDDTPCDTQISCAPPVGACCVSLVCIGNMNEEECLAQSGEWYEGEDCATFECPSGACCVDMVCVGNTSAPDCADQGGIWYAGEDCAIFQCPDPANVPTLSEWGMLIMGLLLLAFGTVAVVRRRKLMLRNID